MTEQQIQSKRIKQLESEGYYVLKLIKTNKNGIPDLDSHTSLTAGSSSLKLRTSTGKAVEAYRNIDYKN